MSVNGTTIHELIKARPQEPCDMVKFVWFDWTMGQPDIRLNVIWVYVCEVSARLFLDEIDI